MSVGRSVCHLLEFHAPIGTLVWQPKPRPHSWNYPVFHDICPLSADRISNLGHTVSKYTSLQKYVPTLKCSIGLIQSSFIHYCSNGKKVTCWEVAWFYCLLNSEYSELLNYTIFTDKQGVPQNTCPTWAGQYT